MAALRNLQFLKRVKYFICIYLVRCLKICECVLLGEMRFLVCLCKVAKKNHYTINYDLALLFVTVSLNFECPVCNS